MHKQKKKIKCESCGYSWETKSKLTMVTCPSCTNKTKTLDLKKAKLKGGK